jgi:hypothetical protein
MRLEDSEAELKSGSKKMVAFSKDKRPNDNIASDE